MFWGDYLKDTGHLSTAEHGAYLLLIGHYWTTGKPIPDNEAVLSRITRQSVATWRKMSGAILAFFVLEDGLWEHGRVEAELDRATRFIERQSANGSKGGRPKTQTKPTGNPNHNLNGTTSASPSPPNNTSHGEISTAAASASASPDGPPRSQQLPDSAKWAERLDQFKPWLPHGERGQWPATWGLRPDSSGRNPLIPPALYAAWRAKYDAAMETQTA